MRDSDGRFASFLARHAKDFPRIARASRGEFSADDVRNEAWLLAFDIGAKRGQALDLDKPDDAELLLGHLYNHCVRYGETVVRHATRLDHAAKGDDEHEHHWLQDRLAADGGAHPLSLLESLESAVPEMEAPDPYHSPAAGWAWLIRHCGQRMADVAAFLLISPSWCYACFREARDQATTQWPLPALRAPDEEAAIRPWRKFKLPSTTASDPAQLPLDYWGKPPQPMHGQLWLL